MKHLLIGGAVGCRARDCGASMGPTGSVRGAARGERARSGGYIGNAKPDEPDASRREGDVVEGHRPRAPHPPPAPYRSSRRGTRPPVATQTS